MLSTFVSPAAWARRSAAHPRRVLAAWALALLASLAIVATMLGSALTSGTSPRQPPSRA
jgi:hypothetical protein